MAKWIIQILSDENIWNEYPTINQIPDTFWTYPGDCAAAINTQTNTIFVDNQHGSMAILQSENKINGKYIMV